MTTRSGRQTVRFDQPFTLEAAGRSLPAGTYEVITDEELVEGLSFPVYRRVATMIIVPAPAPSSATEMLTVDPRDLTAALERDGRAVTTGIAAAKVQ
jgi:hypothetical protein